MKYIASEIKNTKGVSLLVEKAAIKKTNTPLIMAALIVGEGKEERELLRDLGAWFQSKVVSELADRISRASFSRDELSSFIEEYYDDSCGKIPEDLLKKTSFAFCIDDNAFVSGENAFILQNQFGRIVSVPATCYEDGMIKLDEGACIILTNGDSGIPGDKECLDCLMEAADEDSLSRAVREVSERYPSALICIKVC